MNRLLAKATPTHMDDMSEKKQMVMAATRAKLKKKPIAKSRTCSVEAMLLYCHTWHGGVSESPYV